jgi:uncharacterized tellurite resistance protein B-like protein
MLHKIKSFFETREQDNPQNDQHALRLATASLLMEISRADQHISREERETMLRVVSKVYDLSTEESNELVLEAEINAEESISLHEFTRVLNRQLSRAERIEIIEMLWQVANADQEIDQYEDYYVRKIADLLHVSHSDFIRMKHRVLGED